MLTFMNPRLAEIIDELLEIVQAHPQDLNWQPYYDDQEELLRDLRDHAERARSGDASRLPELKFSLLPTGDLNEIAFSSGSRVLRPVLRRAGRWRSPA